MSSLHNQILSGGFLAVLGGGESGVGTALLGKARGWDVLVSDAGKLSDKNKAELEQAGIPYEDGSHSTGKILSADLIVKSPGIPNKTAIVQQTLAAGKPVIGEIEFAWHYKPVDARIVGITGSNGKSTTTQLTYHLMEQGGLDTAIGGNIGYSFARLLTQPAHDWYVLELSSFQLDDIVDFRPDVAVVLNITPDHLDRYDYDFAKYAASKYRITRNQKSGDLLILNADDAGAQDALNKHTPSARMVGFTMNPALVDSPVIGAYTDDARIVVRGPFADTDDASAQEDFSLSHNDSPLRGKHNIYNSMAAMISACAAGVRRNTIRQSFATFKGLEHRLEAAGEVGGVSFINDSKATNVNSVWYALESMRNPVVLILGGQDKGNDYGELTGLARDKVKAIVCMGIDNSPILAAFAPLGRQIVETQSAKAAVEAAYALAAPGDTVLLSPGCASFDLFKNYEDRGRQFKAAVAALAQTAS